MVLTIIIFQGLVFLALILILRHFMKGHVSGAVGHLQRLNDELVKQQVTLKEKIAAAEKEYETKMVKLQQEVTARQAESRQAATKALEEARQRALQEREKIINEAVETREKMRQEIMAEMEEKAVQHSKEIIVSSLTPQARQAIHEILVREVAEGIRGESKMDHFQIASETAELRTAEPLTNECKQQIQKALKEKIRKEFHFKEASDPSLIAGVILKFGSFVIDGSLLHRLEGASARVRQETVRKYQGKV